jgi:hypothetical protein
MECRCWNKYIRHDTHVHLVLEFAAALSSLSLLTPYPSSTIPLCSRLLHKLGNLLLDRLVVQTLQRDLGLLSIVCRYGLAVMSASAALAALIVSADVAYCIVRTG